MEKLFLGGLGCLTMYKFGRDALNSLDEAKPSLLSPVEFLKLSTTIGVATFGFLLFKEASRSPCLSCKKKEVK